MCVYLHVCRNVFIYMWSYVLCSLLFCSHRHTDSDGGGTNRSRTFLMPQAELHGPRDRAPCCPPGSCQGESFSEGRAAGKHRLDVTHGRTDTCVHGHAFLQTATPTFLTTRTNINTLSLSKPHTCICTNSEFTVTNIYMH